jgi:hypothetical protein
MAPELPIRTSNSKPNSTSLLSLPNEIISAICCSLCFHCRADQVVSAPSAAVVKAYRDQVAIAYLSHCSKRLRGIAQPILFHWYHELEMEDWRRRERRLESFVEAIIRNRHLAPSVKALAFYQPEPKRSGLSDAKVRGWRVYEVDMIARPTAEALGTRYLSRRARTSRPACFLELQGLAIAIAPRLSQLCFNNFPRRTNTPYNWTSWSYALPSLTYLALPEVKIHMPWAETTIHIREAKQLARRTPNLETLVFPEPSCGGRRMRVARRAIDEPWDVPLPKLKKLSLNGLAMPLAAQLLAHCPQLTDFEYDEMPDDDGGDDEAWTILNPSQHLAHVQATLRRLCYSVRSSSLELASNHEDGNNVALHFYVSRYDYTIGGPRNAAFAACPSGLSLAAFPLLEELEIDQILLYGPIFRPSYSPMPTRGSCMRETTPEHFLSKLPRSLRRLHVSSVIYWPAMYRDLLALLEERERFPRLEQIVLQVYAAPDKEEGFDLVDRFWDARGVGVSVWEAPPFLQLGLREPEGWTMPLLFG